MINEPLEELDKNSESSTLRIVAKRGEEKEPYTVNIPVKEREFSLVLPEGYINWPKGKPYPDPVKIEIDEERNLWVNFGFSENYGFYASLKISENGGK